MIDNVAAAKRLLEWSIVIYIQKNPRFFIELELGNCGREIRVSTKEHLRVGGEIS